MYDAREKIRIDAAGRVKTKCKCAVMLCHQNDKRTAHNDKFIYQTFYHKSTSFIVGNV